jgi:signal transduction histidine kinase
MSKKKKKTRKDNSSVTRRDVLKQDMIPCATTERLGIIGMRERAALIGGVTEIESSPRGGTTVFVRVPLKPAE